MKNIKVTANHWILIVIHFLYMILASLGAAVVLSFETFPTWLKIVNIAVISCLFIAEVGLIIYFIKPFTINFKQKR